MLKLEQSSSVNKVVAMNNINHIHWAVYTGLDLDILLLYLLLRSF